MFTIMRFIKFTSKPNQQAKVNEKKQEQEIYDECFDYFQVVCLIVYKT